MNLPVAEWIPGNLALEYVKSELPDYSVESIKDLLMVESFEKGRIYHQIRLMTDDFSWPPRLDLIIFERNSLLFFVKSIKKNKQKKDDPTTRERDTLMKLIIGMAVSGYSYDPDAAQNKATTEISDDLVKLGVPLHADTVRKWLREAAEYLPRDHSTDV